MVIRWAWSLFQICLLFNFFFFWVYGFPRPLTSPPPPQTFLCWLPHILAPTGPEDFVLDLAATATLRTHAGVNEDGHLHEGLTPHSIQELFSNPSWCIWLLLFGWLHARSRWRKSCPVIGYLHGQDWAILTCLGLTVTCAPSISGIKLMVNPSFAVGWSNWPTIEHLDVPRPI